MAPHVSSSPPRVPTVKYTAPHGTRWAKEKAAAGQNAFDFPDDPKTIGPWIIGECVGKGASGRVKIAKHRVTGQLAAVKILPIQPLFDSRTSLATKLAKSDKQRLGIDREIAMMKLMNHPNIMRIYDVYEGDKELFLVLEYVAGGELFDFLVNRGRLPPLEALCFFKQIVYGLNYAHTFSIIHRDLKPENILIHSIDPPLVKIADWGMAAFAPPTHKLDTSCGSPHYASPEIVNGEKYNGTSTDIWSCGVILFALLTGRLPFDDKNIRHLLTKVKSGKFEIPSWIEPNARDLISRMLVVDVSARITIPEIMEHPWFQTPTPLVTYVPAPLPLELARPIHSNADIDVYNLESLRVIWGRQSDPWGETIRKDLLSPVGEGTLAKAFYFLLTKYRERVQLDGGLYCEGISEHRLKQYVAPPPKQITFKPTEHLKTKASHPDASVLASPIVIHPAPLKTVAQNAVGATKFRSRTASPAGPRAQSHLPPQTEPRPTRPISIVQQDARVESPSPMGGRDEQLHHSPQLPPKSAFPPHRNSVSMGPQQRRLTQMPNTQFVDSPIQSPQNRSRPQSTATSPRAPQVHWLPSPNPNRDNPRSPVNRGSVWSPDLAEDSPLKSTPASPVIIHAPVPVLPATSKPATSLAQQANSMMSAVTSPDVTRRPFGNSNNSSGEDKPVLGVGGNGRLLPEKAPAARRLLKGIALEADVASFKENVNGDALAEDQSWMYVDPAKLEGGKAKAGMARPVSSIRPKRSTISLLASPIILSHPGPSEPTAALFVSSPHLADHKRSWFSQFFQKKHSHADSTAFSALPLHDTGRLIVSAFVGMGVRAWTDGSNVVRVKVEEDSVPGVKPARFRLELTPINVVQGLGSPAAPSWGGDSPDPSSLTPRMLSTSKSAQYGQAVPGECAVVVVCVHEKGSATGVRTMFRRLKGECEAGGSFVGREIEGMEV